MDSEQNPLEQAEDMRQARGEYEPEVVVTDEELEQIRKAAKETSQATFFFDALKRNGVFKGVL
jgi:hypothetical protein